MDEIITNKIEDFFSTFRLRKYEKGQILILNGDETIYIYHLVSGKVKEYDVTYRGDEIILNIFKPPAFFPMSLALNKVPNPYIYEAETDIEVHQVPAGDAIQFLKDNPDVVLDLLSRVYRGVDGMLGRMAALMSGSAKSRLMYELILEARRFSKKQNNGSYILDVNERDIGARAGLSRETVSREMRKLKNDGLVSVSPPHIIINNLDELELKLGQAV
jgi:CRP-like cAMP-binding protein